MSAHKLLGSIIEMSSDLQQTSPFSRRIRQVSDSMTPGSQPRPPYATSEESCIEAHHDPTTGDRNDGTSWSELKELSRKLMAAVETNYSIDTDDTEIGKGDATRGEGFYWGGTAGNLSRKPNAEDGRCYLDASTLSGQDQVGRILAIGDAGAQSVGAVGSSRKQLKNMRRGKGKVF